MTVFDDMIITDNYDEVAKIHSDPKYINWRCEVKENEYRFYSPDYGKNKDFFQNINKLEDNNVISNQDGVLVVNDNDIPLSFTKKPLENETILVHSTDFFPANKTILSNADGNKKVSFEHEVDDDIYVEKHAISPRQTVHFCINGRVKDTPDGRGSWNNQKYIILEPYFNHKEEFVSGPIHGGDNYTNNSVKLSDKAILMVREDAYDLLTDEQKKMYHIVKYSGDASKCVDNLLTAIGVPIVENVASDSGHNFSDYYAQEFVLEKRAKEVKLIKNIDLNNSERHYFFTTEEITLLYKKSSILHNLDVNVVKKINEELGLNEELFENNGNWFKKSLANFIISHGVLKVDANHYCLLSVNEIEKHYNNPDFYIEAVRRSGTGLSELLNLTKNISLESYQNEHDKLHRTEDLKNIYVGELQTYQGFDTLKKLKEVLLIEDNKVLILREDGLYLSERKKNTGAKTQYGEKDESEILLGENDKSLLDVLYNYKDYIASKSNVNQTKGVLEEENVDEMQEKPRLR